MTQFPTMVTLHEERERIEFNGMNSTAEHVVQVAEDILGVGPFLVKEGNYHRSVSGLPIIILEPTG
jgi:hypothetical protein